MTVPRLCRCVAPAGVRWAAIPKLNMAGPEAPTRSCICQLASAAGLSKGPTATGPRPGVDTPGVVSQGR